MGDLIPLAEYATTRDAGDTSPWFRPAPEPADWDPCGGCPVRGACREVRECQWGTPFGDDPEPGLSLRLVGPPDIVA